MIPGNRLKKLKPLPDQVKRMRSFKKRLKKPAKSINLSYCARQRAFYPAELQRANYNGPKGSRCK